MADYLASILAQEQKRLQDTNPFLSSSASLQKGIPYAPQADWRYNLAAGLLAPLAGGAFQGIGQNQITQSLSDFGQQLNQYGQNPDLNNLPAALERYRPTLEMQNISDDLQLAQQKKLIDARYKSLFGESDPRTAELSTKMLKGVATEEEETELMTTSPRLYRENRMRVGQKGTAARHRETTDLKLSLGDVPGWMMTNGGAIPPGEATKLKEANAAMARLTDKYDYVAKHATNSIYGVDAKITAAIRGEMFNIWRLLTNSGARLEGPEKKFIQGMLAADMRGDPIDWMVSVGLGSDPKVFAQIMGGLVEKSHRIGMLAQGWFNPSMGLKDLPIKHLVDASHNSEIIQEHLNSLDITQFDPREPEGAAALQHLRRYREMLDKFGTGLNSR